MTAANPWIELDAPRSPHWGRLALALLLGAVLGAGVTALASDPRPAPGPGPAAPVLRTFEPPALDREWRGYRTPVDVDRMFPRRGRSAAGR